MSESFESIRQALNIACAIIEEKETHTNQSAWEGQSQEIKFNLI